jgi:hypothetical protein
MRESLGDSLASRAVAARIGDPGNDHATARVCFWCFHHAPYFGRRMDDVSDAREGDEEWDVSEPGQRALRLNDGAECGRRFSNIRDQ